MIELVHFDVEGSARKALAHAIVEGIRAYPAYEAASSFAYAIGEYTLGCHGVLTGPHSDYLLGFMVQDGYQTKQEKQPRSRRDAGCDCP